MRAKLIARLRGFHADRSAQIMPLVLGFGLAFFTGVVLVINTGKTVNGRIEAQNAADAATVSGVNGLARGMNYLARNNVQQAKTLASIVILRAFEPAIKAAWAVLQVWRGVALGMDIAGKALAGFPPTAAAGAALQAAAKGIQFKVSQEEVVLAGSNPLKPLPGPLPEPPKAMRKFTNQARDRWCGKSPTKTGKPAWSILKGLAKFGDFLAYASPVIGQVHAKGIFQRNIPGGSPATLVSATGPDFYLLPLFPNLPICKGTFPDFVDPTTYYAEEYAKPINILGWAVLTMSLFPVAYQASLKGEIKALFTASAAGNVAQPADPEREEMTRLQGEIDSWKQKAEVQDVIRRKHQVESSDLPKNLNAEPPRLGHVAGFDPPLIDKAVEEKQALIRDGADQTDIDAKQDEIEDLEEVHQAAVDEIQRILDDEIKWRKERVEEIERKRTSSGGGPPPDFNDDLGDPLGGAPVQSGPNDPYPYVIDPADHPKKYTYFGLGWRIIEAPYLGKVFTTDTFDRGFVYAAAQLYNPTRADLWTPDWRARLVRADATMLPGNPAGTGVKTCGTNQQVSNPTTSTPNTGGNAQTAGQQSNFLQKLMNYLGRH